ncbi:hypothetical protein ATANTOWER_010579 [Ataeniobius toweri]|uniref:Uncharacterized protein n=1 Tax=Ataeniobius toweri TaxID=208326 RepID=A0ABU7ANW7_9TELE|nr:hypothetical protein [Ataeniobius toweri]
MFNDYFLLTVYVLLKLSRFSNFLTRVTSALKTTWKKPINLLAIGMLKSENNQFKSKRQSVIFFTAGAYLQQSVGGRRGTPWTGCQSTAGQHTNNQAHTHSHT